MGLLLLTEFSPISALLTVLVISLQVVLGESLIGRFSGFNQISRLAKVGLGFCIGAIVSTFLYVFVVTFTSSMAAIISQIVLFVLAALLRMSQISSTIVQVTTDELGAGLLLLKKNLTMIKRAFCSKSLVYNNFIHSFLMIRFIKSLGQLSRKAMSSSSVYSILEVLHRFFGNVLSKFSACLPCAKFISFSFIVFNHINNDFVLYTID